MSEREDTQGTMLRLVELARTRAHGFDLRPGPDALAALRDRLGLLGLRKVRLEGEIAPEGRHDWHLTARLGATVQQPCVVTLEPVTTRLEATAERRYLADWQEPEEAEAEMSEDETLEPLPPAIDLRTLLEEELALALPLYPRKEGAEFHEPDPAAEEDTRRQPFAGLAALKAKMEDPDTS